MTINSKCKFIATAILIFFSTQQALFASTVLEVDVDYLLDKAKLIFEGEVVSSEAKWTQDKTSILTFITFKVKDVIKGNISSPNITLRFAGGTVGEIGLQISGMVYPTVGENGIYFFENPDTQMINPLVGWGQGHFRIKKDNKGVERVLTEGDTPVLGLDIAGTNATKKNGTSKPSVIPFSHGVARGVRTNNRKDAMHTAMQKKIFKDTLKARMSATSSKANSKPLTTGK